MVSTLKNRQGYKYYIASGEKVQELLFDYDPHKVLEEYKEPKQLFDTFKENFGDKYKNMNFEYKKNAWRLYSFGVISCAKFLINFRDHKEFDEFVKSFSFNEFAIAALPMLLEKEIHGYGFSLGCDFLKELGYVNYGKADTHLKGLFLSLKIVDNKTDYEVFKKIVKIAKIVEVKPVIVDKVFWLIGSGDFYESDFKIKRQKKNFIAHIINILGSEF